MTAARKRAGIALAVLVAGQGLIRSSLSWLG